MYVDQVITERELPAMLPLIPEMFRERLSSGRLSGFFTMDTEREGDSVIGVVLFRRRGDYLEIEWVDTTAPYSFSDYGIDLVRRAVQNASLTDGIRGVVSVFRKDSPMADFFPEDVFTLLPEPGKVYEFTLSDIDEGFESSGFEGVRNVIPLKDLDQNGKSLILKRMSEYKTPVPTDPSPDWDAYEARISGVFMEGDVPRGLILMTEEETALEISLLFSESPVGTMALLRYAYLAAETRYLPETPVRCAVLDRNTASLLERIVPEAITGEVLRASVLFPVGDGTSVDFRRYGFSDTKEETE